MNEVRLIDANALKEELLKDKYISWDCEYAVTHEDIKRVIDNAPTVEPKELKPTSKLIEEIVGFDVSTMPKLPQYEERPQGEWIRYKDNPHQPEHIKCSNCGQYWSIADHDKTFDFCFKCGADMRGNE